MQIFCALSKKKVIVQVYWSYCWVLWGKFPNIFFRWGGEGSPSEFNCTTKEGRSDQNQTAVDVEREGAGIFNFRGGHKCIALMLILLMWICHLVLSMSVISIIFGTGSFWIDVNTVGFDNDYSFITISSVHHIFPFGVWMVNLKYWNSSFFSCNGCFN